MNILDYSIFRTSLAFTVFTLISIFCGPSYAEELQPGSGAAPGDSDLQSGQKFEIVGELYAYGIIDNSRPAKLLNITLNPLHHSGPEIISKQPVPIGSIVTIVNKEPKRARAYFIFSYPVRYVVHVNTIDAPPGIPVLISLGSGNEGKSTVLNPLIFKPLLGPVVSG